MSESSVLFDAPGPAARRRNLILTVVSAVVFLVVGALVLTRLADKGQLDWELWKPFTYGSTWTTYILPGLANTLKAAAVGSVMALTFGMVFGLARLSDHRVIRWVAGAVVEFFRAIPLLILIFLLFFVPPAISPIIADGGLGNLQRVLVQNVFSVFGVEISNGVVTVPAFAALVFGLTLYNGSVLAEIVRAGILAVPRGQSEAAYAIGLRKNGVMRLILLPQAVRAMLPAVVSQLVVLLKDTALGFIIAFEDLLNSGFRQIPANYHNLLPAAIIVSIIYIAINLSLSAFAGWLERRSRRNPKIAGEVLAVGPTGLPPTEPPATA
ncbi:amino acid ABC transporter permease [Actinocorallia lasiicapitis]